VARKSIRPLAEITSDQEKCLLEMVVDHDMQWHEILSLVHGWLVVHAPESQEEWHSSSVFLRTKGEIEMNGKILVELQEYMGSDAHCWYGRENNYSQFEIIR